MRTRTRGDRVAADAAGRARRAVVTAAFALSWDGRLIERRTARGRVDAVLHESGAAGWGEAENCARVLIHAGGRLDAAGAFFKGQRVIVYSSGGLGRGTRAALEAMGNVRLHPRKAGGWRLSEVLEDLRARHGVRRAGLCGGPGLFRRLVAEGVLDELCVTWQPRILGGAMPGITGSDESFLARGVSLELVRLERMGDQCAARYRVHPGQQSRITG